MTRHRAAVAALICLVCSLAACSGGTTATAPPRSTGNARPTTLLTIGGSATEGDGLTDRYREAWPYLLFHHAFPLSTTLVNAAVDGATAANVQAQQVPLVGDVQPDVVAIWLGIDDLSERTPIATFRTGLTATIEQLRANGARNILIADLPKAYGDVGQLNTAIRIVVRSTSTTLVELEQAAIVLAPDRRFPAEPDAASQQMIASSFERALTQS